MARDEFDNSGAYVAIKDLEGEFVLFTPVAYVEEVETSFGTKDAVVADVVVLSREGQPEYPETMIFQGAMIGTLKRRISVTRSIDRDPATGVVSEKATTTVKRVVGVIQKGEAKKGQNAPFILGPASPEQLDVARAYVAENPAPEPVTVVTRQYVDLGNGVVQAVSQHAVPATDRPAQIASQAATPAATEDYDDPFAVK